MITEPRRGAEVPLVVLVGQTVEFAIEARRVINVHLAAEWKGPPPVDLAEVWGVPWEGGAAPARIIVAATRHGPCAFSSVRLSFRSVDDGEILPLPAIVARGWGGRLVRGVILADPQRATMVLDPDAFADGTPT